MDELREYIFSVVTASMVCAIVQGVTRKQQSIQPVIKLFCGLFLMLSVVRPLADIRLENLTDYAEELQWEAAAASALGTEIHDEMLEENIIASTRAYILDKAQALSLDLRVTVSLDGEQMPWEVILEGSFSAEGKRKLGAILESDLGIPKERQIWIG